MLNLFKRIYAKIKNVQPPHPIDELIKEGFIIKGHGSRLNDLNVHIADKRQRVLNIEIGDNCCILGTIIVYKSTSKVKIGNNVYIGPGTLLECANAIEIGDGVLISGNCNIIDTNSHSLHSFDRVHDTLDWQQGLIYKNWNLVESKKVSVKSKCWVGLRSIILKGVILEEGTIVGAGSVVTKSSQKFSLIAGNPAKFIKHVD